MKKFLSGFFVAVLFIPAFVVAAPDTLLSLQKEITYLKSQLALYSSSLKLMADRIDYLTEENAAYREQIASFGAVPVAVETPTPASSPTPSLPVVNQTTPTTTPSTPSMPSQPIEPAPSQPSQPTQPSQPSMPTSQPVGASAPVKPATTTYSGDQAYKMYWYKDGYKTSMNTIFNKSDGTSCILLNCAGDYLIFARSGLGGGGGKYVIYNGKVVLSSNGNEIVSESEDGTLPIHSRDFVGIKWNAGDSRNFQLVIPGDALSADQVLNLTF